MPDLEDVELERDLLRHVMASPRDLHVLERVPHARDFSTGVHRSAWQVVWDLDADESPVGFEVVAAELRRRKAPKAAEYVERIASQPRSAGALVGALAVRLLELSRMRTLRDAATRAALAVEAADDIDAAESAVAGILQESEKGDVGMVPMGGVAAELVADARAGTQRHVACPTGFSAVDAMMRGGYHRGHLTVLAARPGVGKSALAGASAMRAAVTGAGVCVFSLEMTRRDWVTRGIQELAGVTLDRLGGASSAARVDAAVQAIASLNTHIDDKAGATVESIRAACRRHQRRHGLDLVIVDYVQLSRTDKRTQNREREVAEISQGLLELAKDLNVAVVAIAQLNRGVEARPNKRPVISDLRDSGQLEQDAHEVFMLYRHSKYVEVADRFRDVVEMHIPKNRTGSPTDPTTPVLLTFKGDVMKWESLPSAEWMPYAQAVGLEELS